MRVRITPGDRLHGDVRVPGDKSVAHRWLILAATARGSSALVGLPPSLDVRSTAACLATLTTEPRDALEAWARNDTAAPEGNGSTWNNDDRSLASSPVEVQGEGLDGLSSPTHVLDCGNSGTTMRLLAGVLAGRPFRSVLTGDASLSLRPMERVAEPLRAMGATVGTSEGHAPVSIEGTALRSVRYRPPVPSAQVKGAILLAALNATGRSTVLEDAPTRDHTERALRALGAPVATQAGSVSVASYQHGGFEGRCPGDPSSAAFLVAAAALTGSELTIQEVGLNPSRTRFLDVMERMNVRVERRITHEEVGEPVGDLWIPACAGITPTRVEADELPLVIDEVPVLALLAAHARGDSWFLAASELRHKESDRLAGVAGGIRDLGGHAAAEGDDLVVAGGGLAGGAADARGDHRMAMAFAISALAATEPCDISGMESAEVSFPGFVPLLRHLGATVELARP